MSSLLTRDGSCLCGAVTFTSNQVSPSIGACHCDTCLKWAGGPFMAIDTGRNIQFNNEALVQRFRSSEWAERGFCKTCGTHLFYRLVEQDHYYMLAGIFNDQSGLVFDHQVFIEEKPNWYCFANETKDMTGAEAFAAYNYTNDEQ